MVYEIKSFDREGINDICLKFGDLLDRMGWGELSKPLHYVIRELVYNAVKANMKRIFLAEHHQLEDEKVVEEFRNALASEVEALMQQLADSDLSIKVQFVDMKSAGLLVRVHNSADMRPEEIEFVDSVIHSSKEEDWENSLDTQEGHREGAGLGLRSVMRILRQAGLGSDSLSYSTGTGETVFELHVKNSM